MPDREKITQDERKATMRWISPAGAVGAVAVAALNIGLYLQTGAWQMLAVVTGEALAIVSLAAAGILARRGRLDGAGTLALLGTILAFGVVELVHSGMTWILAVGGGLIICIIGWLVLPRRWPAWLALDILYVAYISLVNWFEPLPRYDMAQLGAWTRLFALVVSTLLVLVVVWQTVRVYRRAVAIRVRLPLSFLLVVLLPVVAIGAIVAILGFQNGRQQAYTQLESVAKIKEAEIDNWVASLEGDLNAALAGSQVVPRALVLLQTAAPSESQRFWMRSYLQQVLGQSERFQNLLLLNPDGRVLVSSDVTQEGQDLGAEAYVQGGMAGFHFQPPEYSPALGQVTAVAALPVVGPNEQAMGVLAGQVNPATLSAIMGERAWVGDTGEAYLLDRNRILLTPLRFTDRTLIPIDTQDAIAATQNRQNGRGIFDDYHGIAVVEIFHWLPQLQAVLVAKQNQSEALSITNSTLRSIGFVAVAALLVAVGVSMLVTRAIARPLARLTETSARIAAGDLSLSADIVRDDEIGALARSFNSMTDQLRALIGSLEQRVAERTQQLAAAAEVARATTSVLDPDELLRRTVDLVRERFDLYYVGLFLLDEERRFAVLRAGTGEAGQTMLDQRHKLEVSGDSMIGQCTVTAEAIIATDVGKEAVRFDNPLLPKTRSEMALPLRARGRVIGAMTVQSIKEAAFGEAEVAVMQTMADQVAVAIDNARLFTQSEQALESERRAYGELSRQAWLELTQTRPDLGFVSDQRGTVPVGDLWEPEMEQAIRTGKITPGDGDKSVLAIPIQVRGQVIGVVDGHKPDGSGGWTPEEIQLLETLTDQLNVALDGARLYQDTQRRAARERLVGEVTARMRETLDMERVLKTAVDEIAGALGLAALDLQLGGATAPEAPRPHKAAAPSGETSTHG